MKHCSGPYTVETSNYDKVLVPGSGITKGDVIEYYLDVAELMLPHIDDRRLTIARFPDGLAEEGFFQQNRSDHCPEFVGRERLPRSTGEGCVDQILVSNTAGLVYRRTCFPWLAGWQPPLRRAAPIGSSSTLIPPAIISNRSSTVPAC